MILGEYKNGNYLTTIWDDGTKMRITEAEEFIPKFPECIDLKITNYCDKDCAYCHEDSSITGRHADLSAKFIDTLHPYTELAIGGGNPLSHPDLDQFLIELRKRKIIANITVNQTHFLQEYNRIKKLIELDLIKGLGISIVNPTEELISKIKDIPNAVCHVIAGILTNKQLDSLADNNLTILILGYKILRRGHKYYNNLISFKIKDLAQILPEYYNRFKTISFDNLALKQLAVKDTIPEEDWENFYMGDDGQFTMYIDLVSKEYAKSSTSLKRYSLEDDIINMFNTIKE